MLSRLACRLSLESPCMSAVAKAFEGPADSSRAVGRAAHPRWGTDRNHSERVASYGAYSMARILEYESWYRQLFAEGNCMLLMKPLTCGCCHRTP